ncbi:hypothetical protein EDB84DRAFT_1418230 [Lactarius hengduanensis]|nr:hypothetical protein EDB84DRAFT_1418230 [Lactarius hengduanensis]
MSRPPASGPMSQTPLLAAIPPSLNIESIFDTALKSYNKKTKQDLKKHDLFKQLEKCDSPGAILAAFQADQFGPSRTRGDDRLKQWFVPTINVLCAFSATLGEGVGLIFSPAKVVFAGVGVLLLAARDVAASQDTLVDILGRINSFFSRLEIYTGVPLTPAMTEKMVEITIEVLNILATATKEMKESRAKKFVKRVAGRTDLEDGLKKLDKLTLEEVAMASAQLLKVTHDIRNELTVVADGVEGVGQKVQVVVTQVEDVQCDVQIVRDQVEVVDKRVQLIVDDGKGAMATTMEAKFVVQQTADNVDDLKRNQLRENLRRWQSPPDPSTSHNFASRRQHEGTAEWFIKDGKFGEWKVNGSLLWIHGKLWESLQPLTSSAIINDITTLCNEGPASMAYFYFDFRDINKQARHNLLSSLLTQLSDRSDHFCDILYRLYKTHDNGARQPSDSALFQCLKEMLTLPNQGPVYLIMDALDECPDTSDVPSPREQVLELVKDLVGLRIPSLHICITSRPEVDIGDVLEPIASQGSFPSRRKRSKEGYRRLRQICGLLWLW